LLNVGAEDLKGNKTVQEAARLLRAAHLDINYFGFIEGDDISMGTVDVVVTDGFTGNVALKTAEGMARLLSGFMREALTGDPISRLGALVSYQGLKRLRRRMDPNSMNGGVFLGLNGVVVKSHGGAKAEGFASALRVAAELMQHDFRDEIERNLTQLAATNDATASGEGGAPPRRTAEGAS
jgi:glycerol-3-phosphate acyltransferase PlsX